MAKGVGVDVECRNLVGQWVDLAPLGEVRYWTGGDALHLEAHALSQSEGAWHPVDVPEQGGLHVGVEWQIPRQFQQITAHFGGEAPHPSDIRLQYWQHNWPTHWAGGWTAIDDPHNGRWITALGNVEVLGESLVFTFDPLDICELAKARDFAVRYRQSYRFRLLFRKPGNWQVTGFQALSTTKWTTTTVGISPLEGSLSLNDMEIRGGHVLSRQDSPAETLLELLIPDISTQYDAKFMPIPADTAVVTVREGDRTWSFAPDDIRGRSLAFPHAGVRIFDPNCRDWKPKYAKSVYDRITDEPEQTLERAYREIPELVKTYQKRWVMLGCDGARQEVALTFNGHFFMDKEALKVSGRDCKNLLWPGTMLEIAFPTMDPPDFRERENGTRQWAMDGYLPIFTTQWLDREIEFTRTDFAAYLEEEHGNPWEKRGDEAVCVFSKLTLRNTSERPRRAQFWMVIRQNEAISVDGSAVMATGRIRQEFIPNATGAPMHLQVVEDYPAPRLRAWAETGGQGQWKAATCPTDERDRERTYSYGASNAALYEIDLPPRGSHELTFKIPFITFEGTAGHSLLAKADYEAKHKETAQYWRSLVKEGAEIEVPDEVVSDFVKAVLPHVAITADKDLVDGDYLLPAATYRYNVCANEAMHQVRALDYQGHHFRARKYLEPFLKYQGTRGMHGKFQSREGVLHGLRVNDETDYQTFNYNLDHGFVLFSLAEHYLFTRDEDWAKSIAGNLIAACDFVTRERQYTCKKDASGNRVPEYGLLPPGHLEDNPEWLYWYAVNAYSLRGMLASAEVLKCIGHAEAGRIAQEAEEYRADIERSMLLHSQLAPAAVLSDGTMSPLVPTRAQLYSRDLGWIRNSLYGPVHAIECGVMDPKGDLATWILKDTEDNVYISKLRGRSIDERFWFSHGGNTIQSGLSPNVMVYVKRDQPEHAVRCLLNAFAQNIYKDVRCFTEHPVEAFGLGVGPFYKTPDECCWINWLRNALLCEMGYDELIIGPAIPREWMQGGSIVAARGMATWFGPVSFELTCSKDEHEITAVVDSPARNAPARILLRLRHPRAIPFRNVTINGVEASKEIVAGDTIALPASGNSRIVVKAVY